MIALEVEGGTYSRGRHVTPEGFENDCEKYNEAAFYGWKVIRVTSKMVNDLRAINTLQKFIESSKSKRKKPNSGS
jgi:hypothetical protein